MSAETLTARSAPATRHDGPRHRIRRRVSPELTRKYKELKRAHWRLKRLVAVACAALVGLCLALGGWALHVTHQHRSALALHYKERAALADTKTALERTREELASLVAGRIPHLHTIAFDQVLPVGDRYVKNVAFTLLREGGVVSYEYKMVLENDTDIMEIPSVKLLIFDRLGVEIGRSHVVAEIGPDTEGEEILYPGEARSYTAPFDLARNAEPVYFLVEID